MFWKWIILSIVDCVAGYFLGYLTYRQERRDIKRKIKFIKDFEEWNNELQRNDKF